MNFPVTSGAGGSAFVGAYGPRYRVTTSPWRGPDFSRVCWVFPGQGSASVGMFAREFRDLAIFRGRLAEADVLAVARGLPPISDFVFGRPISADVLPIVRLLALFSAEVAVGEYLWEKGHRPELATAFSFGEIAAFATLGVVSFADAVDLVCRREAFCPPPFSAGQMVAASAAPEAIRAALGEFEFHFSNFATPSQTVISLRTADVAPAQKALRRARIASRALKDVPQPYHSPWLAAAAARVRDYVDRTKPALGVLRVPLFSSVLHRLIPIGPVSHEIFAATVSEQMIAPVKFVAQIRAIHAGGCFGFREIGPGEVCSRFIEDILPAAERRIWPLARSLPAAVTAPAKPGIVFELTPANSRLLGGLARAISRITGYELDSIAVESRFQEDLGIDSIKKADILFTVVREAELPAGEDLNVSGIRTVADAVRFLEHSKTAPRSESAGPAIAAEFLRHVWRWRPDPLPTGAASVRPCHALAWSELATGRAPAAEIFLAGLGSDGGDLVIVDEGVVSGAATDQLEAAVLWLRDQVARFGGPRLNLALATCDATAWPVRACGALLKSLVKETSALVCRAVQFDVWPGREPALTLTQREFDADGPVDVRYEKGVRLTGELIRAEVMESEPAPASPVTIAFGGARGITLTLLRALSPPEIGELHIVGRTPGSEPAVAAALAELKAVGREVEYHALDATDAVVVEQLFAHVHTRTGRIDLVINGAGIERSTLLAQKTPQEIKDELAGKLGPALAICAASRRWTPRRLIQFSSLTARFGNTGQTIYGLASQAVDELSRDFAREVPACAVLSLHWPGWDGVGMTAAVGVREALVQSGVALLTPAQGVALFRGEIGVARAADTVVDYHAPRDTWGFELGLRDLRSLAPLLGRRQGLAGFARTLALGGDAFLRDHTLDGRSYLPAAFGVVMCRALASRTGFNGPLENFQMQVPLAVGDTPIILAFQAQAGEEGEGRPRLVGRTSVTHFSCGVGPEGGERLAARDLLPWQERLEPSSLYRPDAFFHGPTFQVLHAIGVDETGTLGAEMLGRRLGSVVGLPPWDRLVQAVDGCFQLLGLDGWRRHRVMALPVRIRSIRFSDTESWPERVRLVAGAARLEDGMLTGDVWVLDEHGAVLIAASEIGLRVLRTAVEPLGSKEIPA